MWRPFQGPRVAALIEVTVAAPRIAGWSFAAVLQHIEGSNILAYVPGWETKVPGAHREAEPSCDHCRTRRERKNTHLVCSEADQRKQVGRQCLHDFPGHAGSVRYRRMGRGAGYVRRRLLGGEYDEDFGGGHKSRCISMASFLAAAAWCVQLIRPGYHSKADMELARERAQDLDSVQDLRVAREAVEWAQALEPKVDDYLWNLRVLGQSDVIELRQAVLAASMIAAHARATRVRSNAVGAPRPAGTASGLGNVGARIETDVTMVSTKFFDNDCGGTDLMLFIDDAGNRIKCWASAQCG